MAAEAGKIDKSKIKEVFNELDLDHNGFLDTTEFSEAMLKLGLTDAEADKAFSIVSGIKRRTKWDDMTITVRNNWEKLGWSKENWGGNHQSEQEWATLSQDQKEAANFLGYTRDVWDHKDKDVKGGAGITFDMLIDAIQSASGLQVTMTRVLTRQMSGIQKRSKIEGIREMMAQREPGRRKNAEAIARIRNSKINGGANNNYVPRRKASKDRKESAADRAKIDQLKKRYNVT